MVKLCDIEYQIDNNKKCVLLQYFEKYPYPLSSFQKYAIEAIVGGDHVLVTAHTGSGKTLPAEFAIEHFVSQGKKVIYTSPIKALSNQKFYEFTNKFPHISFGILTGDIKTNPEADVLIMTTEILMNTLFLKNGTNTNSTNAISSSAYFEMDFERDLACVIFDEVHYINDVDRGHVWESSIMMMPKHVQMVMLSATIDSPEKFAKWVEDQHDITADNKSVYLASTYERVVPLTHYAFITCTQGLFKVLKNKDLEMEIMKNTNRLHTIQDAKGNFMETNYYHLKKYLDIFEQKNHYVKRQHVLNSVARHMVDNNMLPAICFVLSRKALEQCAKEITTNLLEDDSKIPYTIRRECEQIIRKLPNYQEYLNLPEYNTIVSLLEKGIAIHHAGIMPILREMVELMFGKGYVKLLFATETFAVGINMPTKTVVFTDMNKFDGSGMRPFLSHEYTQMAGRAGRRGIDTVGHVIHLFNLYNTNFNSVSLKSMLKGKPQTLTSKFKISYNLLLNLVKMDADTDFLKYVRRSMIQGDVEKQINGIEMELREIVDALEKKQTSFKMITKIEYEVAKKYCSIFEKKNASVNKKKKEAEKEMKQMENQYPGIDKLVINVKSIEETKEQILHLENVKRCVENTLESDVYNLLGELISYNFIQRDTNDTYKKYSLTLKGEIASCIREVHCLAFAELIESNSFQNITSKELITILSCFTNMSIPDEKKCVHYNTFDKSDTVKELLTVIDEKYQFWFNQELNPDIYAGTGVNYDMHYDLLDYVYRWTNAIEEQECKQILNDMVTEKDIFLGEFVKALLKINNITAELEPIAEMLGNMELLSVLKEVPHMTLKFVATNQSLYL
uniref:Helicase n=1 Tax=viral metagenome TaxID=1070528 RepID=A0A6C0IRM9_9ZZZZ